MPEVVELECMECGMRCDTEYGWTDGTTTLCCECAEYDPTTLGEN